MLMMLKPIRKSSVVTVEVKKIIRIYIKDENRKGLGSFVDSSFLCLNLITLYSFPSTEPSNQLMVFVS